MNPQQLEQFAVDQKRYDQQPARFRNKEAARVNAELDSEAGMDTHVRYPEDRASDDLSASEELDDFRNGWRGT